MYGAILYVVGPFVLALMPSRGLGQMGRSFFVNMMIFQCWGLLYAILQALMSALQITDPMQFTGSFLERLYWFQPMIVMSVASVLLSIMIALIPFIASRIVRGDIGSTLMTVVSGAVTAGAVASGLAFAGGEGLAGGRMLAPEGPPPPPSGTPSSGGSTSTVPSPAVAQGGNNGSGASMGQSRPPSPLSADAGGNAPSTGSVGASSSSGDSSFSAAESGSASGSSSVLRNPRSGQVFSWNGSGWQESGHVGSPAVASSGSESGGGFGSTNWGGGNAGHAARTYSGHSLAGRAAWQTGHMVGKSMRWIGMGKEQ